MATSLFRPEALEFYQQEREYGHVGCLEPNSLKFLSWLLVTLVALLVLFVFRAGYTRKETVAGYLAPAVGSARIMVPQRGTISEVHIADDQVVNAGDVLLTVDTRQIAAGGLDVNAAILTTLSLQKNLLTAQIQAEQGRSDAEREHLASTIKNGESELTQLSSQIALQQEQIKISEKSVEVAKQMNVKGYLSLPELVKRQEDLLDAQKALSSLRQQYTARDTQLSATRYALSQLPVEVARRTEPLQSELSQVAQRLAETTGQKSYSIHAPISGRIASLQAKIGQIADPNTLQLEIIPLNSGLEAKLYVPTRAVGFIHSGQKVRLLYDAFPFQRFGVYSGEVISVSKSILSGEDVKGPVPLSEPSYEVIAQLDRQDIDANGQRLPLKAGMLLKADILLEKRQLVRWLLDPILSVRM
jgi:membrane fusion protein